jgi:endopolyphosphatase
MMFQFFFIEAIDLELELDNQQRTAEDVDTTENGGLYDAIIEDFSKLPSTSKVNLDRFAVINVSPPVVPNPYLPTFRIFSYNVSGYETVGEEEKKKKKKKGGRKGPGHHRGDHGNKDVLCKETPYSLSWKCHLSNDSWNSDPEAPSRMNKLWSPTGYAQVSDVPNKGSMIIK